MFVLPTAKGLFEMHGAFSVADDNYIADNRGREALSRYGFLRNHSTTTILFMPTYLPKYTASLLQSFFTRNTSLTLDSRLQTFEQVDERLPADVPNDMIQRQLTSICMRLYELQQREYKRSYEELGWLFRNSFQADVQAKIQAGKERRRQEEAERARQRRIESQLGDLSGEAREAKLRELMAREATKKGAAISEDEAFLAAERAAAAQEKLRRLKEQRDHFQNKLKDKSDKQAALASPVPLLPSRQQEKPRPQI